MIKRGFQYKTLPLLLFIFICLNVYWSQEDSEKSTNIIRRIRLNYLSKSDINEHSNIVPKTEKHSDFFENKSNNSEAKSESLHGVHGVGKNTTVVSARRKEKTKSHTKSDRHIKTPDGQKNVRHEDIYDRNINRHKETVDVRQKSKKQAEKLSRTQKSSVSHTGRSSQGYVPRLENLKAGHLTNVHQVKSPTPSAVNVGMLIVNPKKTERFDINFENKTHIAFGYMFDHFKHQTPIHFVIVTDQFSRYQSGQLMLSFVGKRLSLSVIQNIYKKKLGMPPLHFSLVDYQEIKAQKPEFVDGFRSLNETDTKGKYNEDFFFIAPLYHLAFTSLKRMIVIDCQDLEWHSDIVELEGQFDHFRSKNIIGIGNDLSPHYRENLGPYRKLHPGTMIGTPGRFQGFNSGVVLYDFERMRANEYYNKYLEKDNMFELLRMFMYKTVLAEQDWMTNLGFLMPDIFYILPCTFNAQTSIEYMREGMTDIFDDYHFCDWFTNLKVIHFNGCGSEPLNCGHTGDPEKHKSKKYKLGAYIPPPLQLNWLFFYEWSLRTEKSSVVNL